MAYTQTEKPERERNGPTDREQDQGDHEGDVSRLTENQRVDHLAEQTRWASSRASKRMRLQLERVDQATRTLPGPIRSRARDRHANGGGRVA